MNWTTFLLACAGVCIGAMLERLAKEDEAIMAESRCAVCGSRVELGSDVIKDCDGCIKAYLGLRQAAIADGKKPPPLAAWAKRRAWALGLRTD
jgi:hypothetical protein